MPADEELTWTPLRLCGGARLIALSNGLLTAHCCPGRRGRAVFLFFLFFLSVEIHTDTENFSG
jgi:hypothetical protein